MTQPADSLAALRGGGRGASRRSADYFALQVFTGAWHEYLPDAMTTSQIVNGVNTVTTTYWPNPSQSWLFNAIWFQPQSMDIKAIGLLGLIIGLGMFVIAVSESGDPLRPLLRPRA